jgi:hypothetical protein
VSEEKETKREIKTQSQSTRNLSSSSPSSSPSSVVDTKGADAKTQLEIAAEDSCAAELLIAAERCVVFRISL